MDLLNLQEFVEKYSDASCFIGQDDLNWTLKEKRAAVSYCIKSVHNHPELGMHALRILVRELQGCEELVSNKV